MKSFPKKFNISAGQTLMVNAHEGKGSKLVVLASVC